MEIEKFAIAFKEGAPAFIADLNNDSTTRPLPTIAHSVF
jgi:hypothetical protein